MTRAIDYSALIFPIDKDDLSVFRARSRAAGHPWAHRTFVELAFAALLGCAVLVAVISLIVSVVSSTSSSGFVRVSQSVPQLAYVGLLGSVIVLVWLLSVQRLRRIKFFGDWKTWFRLDGFARANAMTFTPVDSTIRYPGMMFSHGTERTLVNLVRSNEDRELAIGNYRFVTGSGRSKSTHLRGFMALRLDRKLPNMVLDAKANNLLFGFTNLPATLKKNQVLSLEGDFDRHFTLYCPRAYERDALYVFTPDLMALLIDNVAPFDVEIVDDWLFVYSQKPFASADPAVYQRLVHIADTVGTKAVTQTDRYRDNRVADYEANVVAPAGRRLITRLSAGQILAVGLVIAIIAWKAMDAFTHISIL